MRGFIGQNEFLLDALFFSEMITIFLLNTNIFGQSVKILINNLILDFRNFFFIEDEVDSNTKQVALG